MLSRTVSRELQPGRTGRSCAHSEPPDPVPRICTSPLTVRDLSEHVKAEQGVYRVPSGTGTAARGRTCCPGHQGDIPKKLPSPHRGPSTNNPHASLPVTSFSSK